jgi:hypothetical protein
MCLTLIACSVAPPRAPAAARDGGYDLPEGAVVVETRALPTLTRGRRRTLVLWMLRPTRHPRDPALGELYTCPEETRGSHYSGPTRVSLIDAGTGHVVNTVELRDAHDGADALALPYRIRAGGYYHVPGVRAGREGRPAIMRLKDYNGDGRALEFALYDAYACMGLETALVGYSERRDRVVQYPIHLTIRGGQQESSVSGWADYLFSRRPVRPGRWKYQVDYRGRGGSLDIYDVRYDARNERFEGTLTFVSQP